MVIHANTHVYHANTRHADRTWINTTCRLSTRIQDTGLPPKDATRRTYMRGRHTMRIHSWEASAKQGKGDSRKRAAQAYLSRRRHAGVPRKDTTRSDSGNFVKSLKIHVKLILYRPRATAITCLSHKEQNVWDIFSVGFHKTGSYCCKKTSSSLPRNLKPISIK